jgi:hypothetical protein
MKPTCTLLLSLLLTAPSLAQELSEADQNLIKAVRDGGGQAMQLAKNDTRITIAFHLSDKDITDDTIKILAGATNVYSVNLRGTKVTDAGMAHLAGMKDLVRLHLEKTAVTDAGVTQLKGLEKLEYLNVYGTAVTDAALKDVATLKSLKKLFVWELFLTSNETGKKQFWKHPEPPKTPLKRWRSWPRRFLLIRKLPTKLPPRPPPPRQSLTLKLQK